MLLRNHSKGMWLVKGQLDFAFGRIWQYWWRCMWSAVQKRRNGLIQDPRAIDTKRLILLVQVRVVSFLNI